MTKAVHARRLGDDVQAYCFWQRACHMLLPNSDIERMPLSGCFPKPGIFQHVPPAALPEDCEARTPYGFH